MRLNRSLRSIRSLAVVALALVAAAARADETKPPAAAELKLSVAVGPAYALGQAADRWAKLVVDRSGGRLAVKRYAGATLAKRDPQREFAALADGSADLSVGSTLNWSTQVKELGVVGLPWIAPERRQLDALLTGLVGDRLIVAVKHAGAVPLAFAALGHRALATAQRPVDKPADLATMWVRVVAAPAVGDLYAALGAQPRRMGFGAAETAFAEGTLDAQDGTPGTFAATHVYALGMQRILLWDAIAEAAVFAVNRARWESWSEPDRALVAAAAREVARELPALVEREEEAALKDLRRGGMTVARLTPSGREAFVAASRAYYEQAAFIAGPPLVREAEAAVAAVPTAASP